MALGTVPEPTGLANPTIDDLMKRTNHNKYALAVFAAERASQINSYFTQLNEGKIENVGPLVECNMQGRRDKPLSIAFREISAGVVEEILGEDDADEGN